MQFFFGPSGSYIIIRTSHHQSSKDISMFFCLRKDLFSKARLKQISSSTYLEIYFKLLFLIYNDEFLQIVSLLRFFIEKKNHTCATEKLQPS